MKKQYVLDTNALLEDPNCIEILRNGQENEVGIPFQVLLELDKLKKEPRLKHLVARAVDAIQQHADYVTLLRCPGEEEHVGTADMQILREIRSGAMQSPILVTNDRILQLFAHFRGIESQEFKSSIPFESESERYTGFVETAEDAPANSFQWIEGKPVFHAPNGSRVIDYEHEVWKVRPRNIYQNLAFELLLGEHIDLVSLQSAAGYGKTYLAMAAAFYLVLERKRFDKIYVLKPMIEIGSKMGYLPGDIEEKMEPYVKYFHVLAAKLHRQRPANKLFQDVNAVPVRFNPAKCEVLPLAFVRGMTIDDAVVIIDETQNLSRNEARSVLTRMGNNVKCYCLGDTNQVDNPYLNESNNALNWIVRKLKGRNNYAHLVLKGVRSRGPICDMVIESGL